MNSLRANSFLNILTLFALLASLLGGALTNSVHAKVVRSREPQVGWISNQQTHLPEAHDEI